VKALHAELDRVSSNSTAPAPATAARPADPPHEKLPHPLLVP
jgi:hypothetical protein